MDKCTRIRWYSSKWNISKYYFDFAIDTKWSTGVWFNNDFVKGQWVNVTCKMSSSKAGDSGIIIRATNEKSSSALNFYFDDISLTKIEKRP